MATTRDRRRRKVICRWIDPVSGQPQGCGAKMLAASSREKFTWYKCTECGATRKVFPEENKTIKNRYRL